MSYKAALLQAKMALTVLTLGIENISVRETATGARAIEIPGPRGPKQGDLLARSLLATLAAVAKATRPVKLVDVRFLGLDDSVTREEVVLAAASKANARRRTSGLAKSSL